MCCFFFFFFQAEDGIRDLTVTGVQTCALPISRRTLRARDAARRRRPRHAPRARRRAARGGCARGGTGPQGQTRRQEAQVLRRPGVRLREGETLSVSNGRVWYFAYGSNMETATLRGRRGIEPLCALGARAAGWRLVLDKPPLVPVGEAFANIVP